jgi:hypothetical protein
MTLLNLHAHQCTHGFSANPNLLLNVVTRQQAIQIARTLGYEKLKNWQSHNWRLSRYSEIGEKSRNKRTTLEFGRFRGKFRRFRDKMKEVNRSFKVKISSRTRVNKELNLSDIRMRNRLWIYVSREE